MKRRCEFCWTTKNLNHWDLFNRPMWQVPYSQAVTLCYTCHDLIEKLITDGKLRYRNGPRDTYHSRYSFAKAAVKRARFGNPNINAKEIDRLRQPSIDYRAD